MAKTYCTCEGMRSQLTQRGGNDGCRASVQSYDGSVIIENEYRNGVLFVKVGTHDGSCSCRDSDSPAFFGTFQELKDLLALNELIKSGRATVTKHRAKSNKQLALERAFGGNQ